MTDKRDTEDQDQDLQNGTVRRGGEAAGGIASRQDDPTSPAAADEQARERDAAQAEAGFGDDRARSTL